MYRTYIINAPMIFTGLWRAVRIFLHPVTAAKISVSSWGYEKTFHRDGIVLFGSNLQESMVPWRKMAQRLASNVENETPSMSTLAAGYSPKVDADALAALSITPPGYVEEVQNDLDDDWRIVVA